MDNHGFRRPAKDLAPSDGCGQPCVRAVVGGRTTGAEALSLWIRGRLFHSRPQSCSLTGRPLSGCQVPMPAQTMHCQKNEQPKDNSCKSMSCVGFTRQSDSCPQSCPTNMGTDGVFGVSSPASLRSFSARPVEAPNRIGAPPRPHFFCGRPLSLFSFLHLQYLNSRNR